MVTKKTVYLCDICDSQFPTRKEAEKHERIPVPQGRLPVGLVFKMGGIVDSTALVILANGQKVDENHTPLYSVGHIRRKGFMGTRRIEYDIITSNNYCKGKPDFRTSLKEEDVIPISDAEFKKISKRLYDRNKEISPEVYRNLTNCFTLDF